MAETSRGAELLDAYILRTYPRAGNDALGDELGVAGSVVWRWRYGHMLPSGRRPHDIERVTRGAVPALAWFEPPKRAASSQDAA